MPSTTTFFTALAGVLALAALYVYLFGIPPQWKRAMEDKALETMGENKASYMMKNQINKVPASDQQDVKELKKGISNLAGGALQNPLGKETGNVADRLTSPLTGRQH
ncbi:hypothetical protein C1H76_4446 [Elsinoe australis]|uniref:Uncharacterized protein n=1 Tax=Elsinoe australis TaxID=40998 RepID=A0A2P8AJ98_9PEZI|nr:hypothetical protein B9Z65_702 [Elsinoe australis]TKX23378.1 hypothetical protein C1H76_4446 [Elsinoe australis]